MDTFINIQLLQSLESNITIITDKLVKNLLYKIYIKNRCMDTESLNNSNLIVQIINPNLNKCKIFEKLNDALTEKRICMNYLPKLFLVPSNDEFEIHDQSLIVLTQKGLIYFERIGDEFELKDIMDHLYSVEY